MKIAACYIRVSTDEQLEFSPDAQKRALMEYVKKNDMILTEEFIFVDEGISGRKAEKRPAFMRMVTMAKKKPKPFDVILVHKFDRFARNREDSVVYKSLLRKECGIQVISITEQMEDDKFSVILEAMLEAMAEYYSLNLSDEVMKGMAEKARRGGILGKAPFGYINVGSEQPPEIVQEEAEIVKTMFHKIYNHEMMPFALARYLNSLGLFTRKGKTWSTITIKQVLSNPFYTGKIIWNRLDGNTRQQKNKSDWIIAEGKHEAIIEADIFNEVQEIVFGNQNKYRRSTVKCAHWLSGVLKCSNCGKSLSIIRAAKYPAFQCIDYNKGKCNISHYAPMHFIEKETIEMLKEICNGIFINIKFEKRMSIASSEEGRLQLLKENLRISNNKFERTKAAYVAGIDTLEEYGKNKKRILAEIQAIESEIQKIVNYLDQGSKLQDMNKFRNIVSYVLDSIQNPKISIEEKNNAIKSVISKLVFNKNTKIIDAYFFMD